jgi:arginyl-tRNA synthetase
MFNRWYAQGKIIDSENPDTPYKLAIVKATSTVIKKGLYLLGIESPEKM